MRYTEQSSGSSHIVRYIYDKINNLTSTVEIINGVPHQTYYAYDDDNRITSATVGDLSRSYDYDAFGRLIVKDTKKSGASVLYQRLFYRKPTTGTTTNQVGSIKYTYGGASETHTYTYDKNGNILSVNNGTSTTSYVYDSQNQLIRENNQAANKTWVWEYDNAGNITSRKEYAYATGTLGTAVDTVPYTYGDTTWGDLMTTYDGNWIHYDGVGNPDTDGTWNYSWRNGRELASMTNGTTTTWTFTYNADGLRTKRTSGSATYTYIYNGTTLSQMTVGNDTLYFIYDASGTPTAVVYNGTTYYYQTNLQGDIIALLDNSGTKVVEYTYDAWGKVLSRRGTLASTLGSCNPLRYRGYVYDTETGLYYLQSRYYNPDWGRFLNADVFAATGQGFIGNNMFAYCGNNPVRNVDPGGTSPVDIDSTLNGTTFSAEERFPSYLGIITVTVSLEVKLLDGYAFVLDNIQVEVSATTIDISMPDGTTFSYEYDWTGVKPDNLTKELFDDSGIGWVIDENGLGLSAEFEDDYFTFEMDVQLLPNPVITLIDAVAEALPPVGGTHGGGFWGMNNKTLMFK